MLRPSEQVWAAGTNAACRHVNREVYDRLLSSFAKVSLCPGLASIAVSAVSDPAELLMVLLAQPSGSSGTHPIDHQLQSVKKSRWSRVRPSFVFRDALNFKLKVAAMRLEAAAA